MDRQTDWVAISLLRAFLEKWRHQPFDAHCCHIGTAIKHPVPAVICSSHLTSGHSDAQPWASDCPHVKNYKCANMTTVVGKGLDQSFRGYADIALSHITKLQVRCPNWFPLHPRIRSIAGGRRPSSSVVDADTESRVSVMAVFNDKQIWGGVASARRFITAEIRQKSFLRPASTTRHYYSDVASLRSRERCALIIRRQMARSIKRDMTDGI